MSAGIRWEEGRYGTMHGFIGTKRFFTISWSLVKNDDHPVVLRSILFDREIAHVDAANAKAHAESLLGSLMGALLDAGITVIRPYRPKPVKPQ